MWSKGRGMTLSFHHPKVQHRTWQWVGRMDKLLWNEFMNSCWPGAYSSDIASYHPGQPAVRCFPSFFPQLSPFQKNERVRLGLRWAYDGHRPRGRASHPWASKSVLTRGTAWPSCLKSKRVGQGWAFTGPARSAEEHL